MLVHCSFCLIFNTHCNWACMIVLTKVTVIKCKKVSISIFRRIHYQNHHFSFLQDTHSSKDRAITWEAEWGGKALFSHGFTNSKGLMVLINPKLNCKIKKVIAHKDGDVFLNQIRIVLLNIYRQMMKLNRCYFRAIRR